MATTTTRMSFSAGMISFTSAYRSLLFVLVAVHAAPFVAALSVDSGVKVTPAETAQVCADNIEDDDWSTLGEAITMVAVFCLGWLVARPGIFYISMQGRTHKRAEKAIDFDATTDAVETSVTSFGSACGNSDCAVTPCKAGAAHQQHEQKALPIAKGGKDAEMTPACTTAPASPASTIASTASPASTRCAHEDQLPTAEDLDLLFDSVDGFSLCEACAEGDLLDFGELSSDNIAAAEAKLCDCAAWHDLASCWQILRSVQEQSLLSDATCFILATAVRHAADTPADAESALEVALASRSSHLAEAALEAGAKACDAAWLLRAGERLYASGMPRTTSHAVDLAHAYGREHRADLACDLWQEHRASCSAASDDEVDAEPAAPQLYAAALEACVRSGDFESALRLVESAESGSQFWSPASRSGQAALLGLARWLAKRQDLAAAQKCVAAVQAAGGRTDLRTFRALLRACARSFNMDKAEAIFKDLQASGLAPDFACLSTMVRGLCAVGHIEQGLEYLSFMRRRGFTPDSALFDAILDACARRGAHTLMETVLADMEELRVGPTNSTLAVLVRFYGSQGMLGMAVEVFSDMPRKHCLEVNAHSYCALIDACLSNGRLSQALDTFDKMAQAGGQANVRTYEGLITSCLRSGDLERAVDLVDHALGLEKQDQAGAAEGRAPPAQRALLEISLLDDALRLTGKRRRVDLGAPLLARLQAAGISVSEDVAAATLRAAEQDVQSVKATAQQLRRADFQRWRDFSHSQ